MPGLTPRVKRGAHAGRGPFRPVEGRLAASAPGLAAQSALTRARVRTTLHGQGTRVFPEVAWTA